MSPFELLTWKANQPDFDIKLFIVAVFVHQESLEVDKFDKRYVSYIWPINEVLRLPGYVCNYTKIPLLGYLCIMLDTFVNYSMIQFDLFDDTVALANGYTFLSPYEIFSTVVSF